jgi:large subunit ribosomal protein L21
VYAEAPGHESLAHEGRMYAVIEAGGKQYRVEEGSLLKVERLRAEPGESVTLDKVLLVADGSVTKIGTPVVSGATVKATVVAHGKAKKILVMKYKSKVHYRRKRGHRQLYTTLRIDKIQA